MVWEDYSCRDIALNSRSRYLLHEILGDRIKSSNMKFLISLVILLYPREHSFM
jgi:hypothetical protein